MPEDMVLLLLLVTHSTPKLCVVICLSASVMYLIIQKYPGLSAAALNIHSIVQMAEWL